MKDEAITRGEESREEHLVNQELYSIDGASVDFSTKGYCIIPCATSYVNPPSVVSSPIV